MTHTPSADNGRKILTSNNRGILETLAAQSDVAMAKAQEDSADGRRLIEKRHTDEMKAFKRNHKHRAKKIKDRMKEFEAMTPMELAKRFENGVADGLFDPYSYDLVMADYSGFERRIIKNMMMPSLRMGKSEAFKRVFGDVPVIRHEQPQGITTLDIETIPTGTGRFF